MAPHSYRYNKNLLNFLLFSNFSLTGLNGHWILILSEMLLIPPQHWQHGSWYKPAPSAVPHNGNIQLTLKQFSSYWNPLLFRRSPSVDLSRLCCIQFQNHVSSQVQGLTKCQKWVDSASTATALPFIGIDSQIIHKIPTCSLLFSAAPLYSSLEELS